MPGILLCFSIIRVTNEIKCLLQQPGMHRAIDRFNLFGVIDSKDGLQVGIQQNIDESVTSARIVRKARSEGVSSGASWCSCPSGSLGGSGLAMPCQRIQASADGSRMMTLALSHSGTETSFTKARHRCQCQCFKTRFDINFIAGLPALR